MGAAVFRYGREVPVQVAGVLRVPRCTTADATQAVSGAAWFRIGQFWVTRAHEPSLFMLTAL